MFQVIFSNTCITSSIQNIIFQIKNARMQKLMGDEGGGGGGLFFSTDPKCLWENLIYNFHREHVLL